MRGLGSLKWICFYRQNKLLLCDHDFLANIIIIRKHFRINTNVFEACKEIDQLSSNMELTRACYIVVIVVYIPISPQTEKLRALFPQNFCVVFFFSESYRLFWYQVLTCVSVRLRAAARSMRSCTLRYFCRSKLLSSWLSWWSVKAVRALRGFFVRIGGLSLLLEISRSPSSLVPIQTEQGVRFLL